ncbi:MAG: type II toxin-antitoxin system HicA family toxin [Chlamydiae bacterium]|nr:type II toxin-antitoxin system HicA family toxin [Chlamydiota bacterium]MBI3266017.1 type II toxin-antitoxin system HicA family toxin [Chlamydiota bacterium]
MLFTDLSSERIVNAFSKVGFRIIKQGKHIGMSDSKHHLTIPRHKRINPYTLKSIIKDSGLSEEEFKDLI